MPRRYTLDEVQEIFYRRGYKLLETTYKNNKTPLRFLCENHPNEPQKIRLNELVTGHGCPRCGKERIHAAIKMRGLKSRHSFDDVKRTFKDRGYVLVDSKYHNANRQMNYICNLHPEHNLLIRYSEIKDGGGCKYCARDKLKLSFAEVRRRFEERGYVLLETEYVNSNTPMRYICPRHPDSELSISVSSLKGGHGCFKCGIDSISGPSSVHYNHELSDEMRMYDRRYDPLIHRWRQNVFNRDAHTCQICGIGRSGTLNAHHLNGFHWCVEQRYEVDNGVTLCEACHKEFHTDFGYRNNTVFQFDRWKKIKKGCFS